MSDLEVRSGCTDMTSVVFCAVTVINLLSVSIEGKN